MMNTKLENNMTMVTGGMFAGEPVSEIGEMTCIASSIKNGEPLVMDSRGVIAPQGSSLEEGNDNLTVSTSGIFSAVNEHMDQWYNRNPILFQTEVKEMQKRHPDAKYGFMKSTGDMYWVITLDISKTGFCEPYTFMLRYDKDHPHNNNYGGSVKVILLQNPSYEELLERAEKAGRPGVPHILTGRTMEDEAYKYLCTRRTQDVCDGKKCISSAVQVAVWAAEWCAYYELALKDDVIWNKWCNDEHFRSWMVPVREVI